ncbi:ras-related protein Rab-13-like [Oscarella lobularis]|uniref:ras-related protein Rab-13-like n=1 Tax=Oscarella lobularis TaxID=121494 RepID=UPI0033131C20
MVESNPVVAAEYKVVVIGEYSTGKTSIINRFVENDFSFQTMTTIGVDYRSKVVTIDGVRLKLKVWDTAGQEQFRTITRMHFRGAQGIILVYDITSKKSFENLRYWVEKIQDEHLKGESMVLFGNKCDLDTDREVAVSLAEKFARELGIKQFQTSAKDDINISKAFTYLTQKIKDYHGPHVYLEHVAPKAPSFYESSPTLKLGDTPNSSSNLSRKQACACKV